MNNQKLRKSMLCIALGACLTTLGSVAPAHAANNDGSLVGSVAPGAEVTVYNAETGFTRTVTADSDGNYRFPFLPVGTYKVEAKQAGAPIAEPIEVRVSLGNATKIDLGAGATALGTIEVVGSALTTPVDVTSTESATNVTRAEIVRLPVDRTLTDVALLAPGLGRGDTALGGISFGGSSVAENSVYINGLNVTDFYNRIGFSSVPFSFYEEVQVKTGGYSVEFGRTTGGVINSITRSGTNEFHYGAELNWEPSDLQSEQDDHFDDNNDRYYTARFDEYDRTSLTVHASGPIIQDRLHFFAMYEARDYQPDNTSTAGDVLFQGDTDDGFYGVKLDWSITDHHLLEFLAFSDEQTNTIANYAFDAETGERGAQTNTQFIDSGGDNWAATYTGYLTENFSVKAMYGEVERNRATSSLNDINCNRVFDNRTGLRGDKGCTASALVEAAVDDREAARLDFEWILGDHVVRFGLDHETNTSDYQRFYPGPGAIRYDVFTTSPGATLANGGVVPPGVTSYVRTRRLEVAGQFETENEAYYIEDSWSITPDVILSAGLRMEAFDNKNSEGESYIKIDDMFAPRLGVAWDVNGDGRSKVFANAGRYFLPVANVINIKQAGGFLDERLFYVFNGYQSLTNPGNGQPYQLPVLGPQIGPLDNSQGDGTVGDLRGEVDADMDPVYQDEVILGFQGMIDDKWSWGVRGIYRELHNAIDDMEITSNGLVCSDGLPGSVGFVMANPGDTLTVYTDTNCDEVADGFVDIDTSVAGWALYDDDGNYIGDTGFDNPRRTYQAVEFVLDRAWDDVWSLNLSYTWSKSEGNAEGPVNSDTNFGDAGRTEAFDDPWVNYEGYGYLPNDHRHSIKGRGTYALSENWQLGGTMFAQSGRPINAFGVGNPFDGTNYHSFYTCTANCTSSNPSERVYELNRRGSAGHTPWIYDFGASISYLKSFEHADLRVKFAVYNLFNGQRTLEVDEDLQTDIGDELNDTYRQPVQFQSNRFAQFTVSVEF